MYKTINTSETEHIINKFRAMALTKHMAEICNHSGNTGEKISNYHLDDDDTYQSIVALIANLNNGKVVISQLDKNVLKGYVSFIRSVFIPLMTIQYYVDYKKSYNYEINNNCIVHFNNKEIEFNEIIIETENYIEITYLLSLYDALCISKRKKALSWNTLKLACVDLFEERDDLVDYFEEKEFDDISAYIDMIMSSQGYSNAVICRVATKRCRYYNLENSFYFQEGYGDICEYKIKLPLSNIPKNCTEDESNYLDKLAWGILKTNCDESNHYESFLIDSGNLIILASGPDFINSNFICTLAEIIKKCEKIKKTKMKKSKIKKGGIKIGR